MTVGLFSFSFNGEFSFPMMLINSSSTSINFWPGFPLTTSSPIALSLTSDTGSLTTDKLTSASSALLPDSKPR